MKNDNSPVFSVSELNRQVRELLESGIPMLVVEGEISNFVCPASGHWYFTLKDDRAQVRCALFKNRNRFLGFRPKNGDHVRLRAKVSLFEGRGEFQLIGEFLEEAGAGALQAAFEALKKRLDTEGLFDPFRKQALPTLPKHIGIITSPTGAAVHDMLTVLKRRFPAIPVSIFPAVVQGKESPAQLIRAIELANRDKRCDVLIIGRGGGSLEDLWAFNDEDLARAIAASSIPIVSAVGHEIDFSISDFVADLRAPTPSAAAEILSPDKTELIYQLDAFELQLTRQIRRRIDAEHLKVSGIQKRLRHPGQRLNEQNQRLDELYFRLQQQIQRIVERNGQRLEGLHLRLANQLPTRQIRQANEQVQRLQVQLHQQIHITLDKKKQLFQQQAVTLHTVSPLATLDRGFAIVTDKQNNVIRIASQQKIGNKIDVRLAQGSLQCRVDNINNSDTVTEPDLAEQGELPGL